MSSFTRALALCSLVFLSFGFQAEAQNKSKKVKVENVKVQIIEPNKDPVTITVPYWVAKAGSEIGDLIKVDEKDIDIKKILTAIENAPQLGTIMTIEEKTKKIIVSIE